MGRGRFGEFWVGCVCDACGADYRFWGREGFWPGGMDEMKFNISFFLYHDYPAAFQRAGYVRKKKKKKIGKGKGKGRGVREPC